jgi:hypothetical protein
MIGREIQKAHRSVAIPQRVIAVGNEKFVVRVGNPVRPASGMRKVICVATRCHHQLGGKLWHNSNPFLLYLSTRTLIHHYI